MPTHDLSVLARTRRPSKIEGTVAIAHRHAATIAAPDYRSSRPADRRRASAGRQSTDLLLLAPADAFLIARRTSPSVACDSPGGNQDQEDQHGRKCLSSDGANRRQHGIVGGSARNAIETAAKTLRDLRIAEAHRFDVTIENGKVDSYRVRINVSFKYEPDVTGPQAHQAEEWTHPPRAGIVRLLPVAAESGMSVPVVGSTDGDASLASGSARRWQPPSGLAGPTPSSDFSVRPHARSSAAPVPTTPFVLRSAGIAPPLATSFPARQPKGISAWLRARRAFAIRWRAIRYTTAERRAAAPSLRRSERRLFAGR